VEIKGYRAIKKGNLDGYLDIFIPSLNWVIKGCGLFINGSKKWVNPPSRQYKDPEGKVCYADIISMPNEVKAAFSKKALEAYDKYSPPVSEPEPDFLDMFR
jgi:hypothetical protein